VHVADLLVGQLQEFIGAGLEGGGGEGLKGVAQLVLVIGPAPRCQQPAGGKPGHQRADDGKNNFQYSECNSDY